MVVIRDRIDASAAARHRAARTTDGACTLQTCLRATARVGARSTIRGVARRVDAGAAAIGLAGRAVRLARFANAAFARLAGRAGVVAAPTMCRRSCEIHALRSARHIAACTLLRGRSISVRDLIRALVIDGIARLGRRGAARNDGRNHAECDRNESQFRALCCDPGRDTRGASLRCIAAGGGDLRCRLHLVGSSSSRHGEPVLQAMCHDLEARFCCVIASSWRDDTRN